MIDTHYAYYKTIEQYEKILGQKVNDAFKIGWAMARTTMKDLSDLAKNSGGEMVDDK